MSFWSRIGNAAKKFVGAGYNTVKGVVGTGRKVLNSIYNLKNVPGLVEVASGLAEAFPEIAVPIAAGVAGAEVVVDASQKGIDLIDQTISRFNRETAQNN
jgi:hypothetical protein